MQKIQAFKLDKKSKVPTRNLKTDAGLDIYSNEYKFIKKGSTCVVTTGIAINIPEGYVGKIEDRSSMAKNGLRTGAGVIDAGFSGEVSIVLHNLTNEEKKCPVTFREGYEINPGDKIAQLVLVKVETPIVEEVPELWNSDRGSNGFGSSGK